MVVSIIAACSIAIHAPLSALQLFNIKTKYFDSKYRVYLDEFCLACEYKSKWYLWESCSSCFGAFVENEDYKVEVDKIH